MLVPFLIMLREGMEAALIVGIVASYLRQSGRSRWLPAVWAGVVLAAALCLALGIALDLASTEFPQRQQELFEGIVGLIAVVILTSMVFWMRKAARTIGAELRSSVDAARAECRRRRPDRRAARPGLRGADRLGDLSRRRAPEPPAVLPVDRRADRVRRRRPAGRRAARAA
jgi:FTR1 family protein